MSAPTDQAPPPGSASLAYVAWLTASEDRRKAADDVVLRGMLQPTLASTWSVPDRPDFRRS